MGNNKINTSSIIISINSKNTFEFETLLNTKNQSLNFTTHLNLIPVKLADSYLSPRCLALQDYVDLINWGAAFLKKYTQMKLKIGDAKKTYVDMSNEKGLKTRANLCTGIAAQFYQDLSKYLNNPAEGTIYAELSLAEIIEKNYPTD